MRLRWLGVVAVAAAGGAPHADERAPLQRQEDGAGAAAAPRRRLGAGAAAAPRRRLARRRRRTEPATRHAAAAAAAAAAPASTCVFHLHTPKCAGTFVWRFFRDKFCAEREVCKRGTLQLPPACLCAVNPITADDAVLHAIKSGGYRFVSAHSRRPFSAACALAVWFREPVSRVRSHYGYVVHRRHKNVTLATLLQTRRPPAWVSDQQWALFLPGGRVTGASAPTAAQVNEASTALRQVAFVGLVEQMDASLCRFARAYLPAHAAELCARGAGGRRENVGRKPAGDARETLSLERVNRFDAALYDLAAAEFARRGAGGVAERSPPGEVLGNVWEVRTDGLDVV